MFIHWAVLLVAIHFIAVCVYCRAAITQVWRVAVQDGTTVDMSFL